MGSRLPCPTDSQPPLPGPWALQLAFWHITLAAQLDAHRLHFSGDDSWVGKLAFLFCPSAVEAKEHPKGMWPTCTFIARALESQVPLRSDRVSLGLPCEQVSFGLQRPGNSSAPRMLLKPRYQVWAPSQGSTGVALETRCLFFPHSLKVQINTGEQPQAPEISLPSAHTSPLLHKHRSRAQRDPGALAGGPQTCHRLGSSAAASPPRQETPVQTVQQEGAATVPPRQAYAEHCPASPPTSLLAILAPS